MPKQRFTTEEIIHKLREAGALSGQGRTVAAARFAALMGELRAGAKLPGVPTQTLNAALDYVMPLTDGGSNPWSVEWHADVAYRSACSSVIDPTSRSYWEIPTSTMGNFSASLNNGGPFTYDLFVNNVSNAAGYSGGRGTAQDPTTLQPLPNFTATRVVARPRTIGVRVHYRF